MTSNLSSSSQSNIDGTDFRDLLKGRIDIIQYLTSASAHGSQEQLAENGSSDDGSKRSSSLMLPSIGQQQQTSSQPHHSHQQYLNPPQPGTSRNRSAQMYGLQPSRLPESPPETDSGAGSAGSPSSGSENSPYSPEFANFNGNLHLMHGTNSVIHPPVVNGQHQQAGVILGVHSMDLNNHLLNELIPPVHSQQAPRSIVHHQNGHLQSPSEYVPYPPPQPTPGALAPPQVSPPNAGSSSACPPSPYVLPPGGVHQGLDNTGSLYDQSMTHPSNPRKRLRSENGSSFVKPEPTSPRTGSDDNVYDLDGYPHQQCIRFNEFQKENWHALCDANGRELQKLGFHVVADKGFNYSAFDGTFVNQKKNHFQISVHIEAIDQRAPKYIRVEDGLKPITEFRLDFYGVKMEMQTSSVLIKQSQTDRKPVSYEPVRLELPPSRVTKVTVARLHFSETTLNNQRKNGRPNPDQKFFNLAVSLNAIVPDNEKYIIVSYASEKVIVRASNPGQFDNGESEAHWQKGSNGNSIFHPGPVCVGTDRPQATLTVGGDIAYTGTLYHPSDRNLKTNIETYNCKEALSRLSQIRIVHYEIRPEIADNWGLSEDDRRKIGVIAQEVEEILPDAVDDEGEYLRVDDNRIFYESAAAVKELCRLTGNLEYKIDEVEKISKKLSRLSKLKRLGSLRSNLSHAGSENSSGVCGSSYISCNSLSSLGSASPTPSRSASRKDGDRTDVRYTSGRQRHHKHCNHACRRGDNGLCSNKVIQTTIIVLVVVMAFCLIAMATLYILDWHKRNYGPRYNPSTQSGNRQPTGPGPGPETSSIKPVDPGKMEVPNATPLPEPPKWQEPKWPEGARPPDLHSCTTLDCHQYCCPNIYSYMTEKEGDSSHKDNTEVRIVLKNTDPPLVGAAFKRKQEEKKTADVEERSDKVQRVKRKVEKALVVQDTAPSSLRVDGWSLGRVGIEIPDLNVTIGRQYCWGASCNDIKRGNFTFYIPVSRYMPHIPLQVQFNIEDKRYIEFCHSEAAEYCFGVEGKYAQKANPEPNDSKSDSVEEKHANAWGLPIGIYMRSSYQFRVGYSTESCNAPADEAGKSFVEYTLVFYRVCSG